MKYFVIILFLLILSDKAYSQNVWVPYQPVSPVYTVVPIQPIFIQPQPVVVYNYPIYQWTPTVTYQPVFVQRRFLFCDKSYWVNQPVVRWIYQPIYR